ncbi:MAG: UDP-N-acetylmuramoyl-L-alanyl-D-glutamate--2,6-diaminopimelate ligase [Candidatus Omnitrophota bacterium]
MRLEQLLKSLDVEQVYPQGEDFYVKGISCDSQTVLDDFIFVAVKGANHDGHNFIDEAITRGARAIIVHSSCLAGRQAQSIDDSCKKVIFIKVKDTRKAIAKLAVEFYGNPSQKMKVVGITGTNGKTTIAYLIEALLKQAGRACAVIGTVNHRFDGKIILSKNTTPGPQELQAMLKEIAGQGIGYAVMEVSSHALDQDRTLGINFHTAVFTNLTQDHLDYHQNMENYFRAKSKLFEGILSDSFAVINNDDEYGRMMQKLTKAKVVTYGIKNNSRVLAKNLEFGFSRTEFILEINGQKTRIKTPLIGRHNIYNILAAVSWALNEGMELSVITPAIEKFDSVPGRLERIDTKRDFFVFVDYAHTEDALKNAINAVREISKERIIVVFGCGGERDRTKRPKMGRIVSELADYAVITNDNPRSEDPHSIINDIERGITKKNYSVIPDRREAIEKSLELARSGDVVLVAGKGHENYQVLKSQIIRFDDREVVRECLKQKS